MLVNPAIIADVSGRSISLFDSLKEVLEAIYKDHEVRSRPRAKLPL